MEYREISYRLLARVAQENDRNVDRCVAALSTATLGWGQEEVEQLRVFLRKTFFSQWYRKWQTVHRISDDFQKKFAGWLEKSFRLCSIVEDPVVSVDEPVELPESTERNGTRGRPSVGFAEASKRSKRRKVKETRKELDPELLRRAAKPQRISADRGLEFLLDNNCTKALHENFRSLLEGSRPCRSSACVQQRPGSQSEMHSGGSSSDRNWMHSTFGFPAASYSSTTPRKQICFGSRSSRFRLDTRC